MTPNDFVAHLAAARATAILRTSDPDAAAPAMEAAVRAGFGVLEFTATVPDYPRHVAEFARRPGLVVGVGTVIDVETARIAVDAGARFLVSPVVDEVVIEEAARLGVAMIPGGNTPTELLRAHRAGAPLQKLFPAPADGPRWLRAVRGPMPFLRVVPTSGVHRNNVQAWLKAGAHAVGFVGPLFDPNDLAARAWDRVEERGRALLREVGAIR